MSEQLNSLYNHGVTLKVKETEINVKVTVICGVFDLPAKASILRKTIEGYGFCFDFIAKGITFSTQIVNRYVAEPLLCKDSIKFSRCLEAHIADLQKRWNTPEIEVPTVAYPTQFCHSSSLTGSFNCKTVLVIEMPVLLCLKCILGKFQKSVIFG